MTRKFLIVGCLLSLLAMFSSPAKAERRVALVIGNGSYAKVPKLANPTNDAGAIEALFKAAGFNKVVRADNLGATQMRRALRDFSNEVQDADMAVVFYAGHGMEMNGTNYLIPVDAVLERDIDVADETVSLDRINQVLEQAKRLRLVILDACRDNPFVRSMRRTLAGRAIGRGLAPVEVATTDTLIAYAAKAGSTAMDGDGANSPYTAALVKHLATPGLDVRLALGRVRDEVLRTTSRRQEPFVYGSLGGTEVQLIAAPRQPVLTSPTVVGGAPPSAAAEAWNQIKETSDASVLEAFVARFNDTFFGDLAKSRLATMRREQQRLALLQKQDEDLKRAEAAAAEAKRKAEEEARKGDLVASLTPGSGRSARNCPLCPEMVVVPAGHFTMGGQNDSISVSINYQLAVGRFAVTRGEFEAFVNETGYNTHPGCSHRMNSGIFADWKFKSDHSWRKVGFEQTDRHPVVCVSWDDANAYVNWLSGKTGLSYRLLSDAEREYATRAGTITLYWWGNLITSAQANYNGHIYRTGGTVGQFRQRTVPVDSFAANPWGLYNVHGNVWDWTEDCWNAGNSGNPGNGIPRTNGDCGRRVIRGGSWEDVYGHLEAADRVGIRRDNRGPNMSFRVARTLH